RGTTALLSVFCAGERGVLVPLDFPGPPESALHFLGREELEDPAGLGLLGILLEQLLQPLLRMLLPGHGRQDARDRSASRAASCSAAFFERPSPTPSCSPSTTAAHVKWRSCGGPLASTTA